jgi:site-specific recombinase XerD
MNDKLFNLIIKRVPKIINLNYSNYIFLMHGRQFNGDYISKSFKKIVKSCKNINQDVHLHSLRHYFASQLVKKNISLVHVKELLGHRDFSTSLIYSHLTMDSLREAVKVLGG